LPVVSVASRALHLVLPTVGESITFLHGSVTFDERRDERIIYSDGDFFGGAGRA
jgi:hypothetical protein